MEADKSPTSDGFTILGSSLVEASDIYGSSHTIDQYVNRDKPNGSEFSVLPRWKKRGPVHMELAKNEYEDLLLMMIIKNHLPISLVKSESFRDFVNFLRDDAPNISRATMRRRLKALNEKALQILKKKPDHNTGKFSNTIDEWRSGNNFYFLDITLHFYNNKFEWENHTIGFEKLNDNFSYSGEVLHRFLMKVLKEYGIENRIESIQEITRHQ